MPRGGAAEEKEEKDRVRGVRRALLGFQDRGRQRMK